MQLGLAKKEIHGFLGVNLRKDRLDLADEELAKAINADLHSEIGTITLRLGRTQQFSTALTDKIIRRIAKINLIRYQVAGQTLYRNQSSILSGLSSNLITTILGFRPLLDTTTWAFIADDALMQKDNGTNIRIWGIVAPTAAPVVAASGGGLTGIYSARYTYARKDGIKIAHESNPSPVSKNLDLSVGSVELTFVKPTDPQVTHVRFYRTVANGTGHLFEQEYVLGQVTTTADYATTQAWETDNYASEWSYSSTGDNQNGFGGTGFQFTQVAANVANGWATHIWEKQMMDGATTFSASITIGVFFWENDYGASIALGVSFRQFTLTTTTSGTTVVFLWEKDHIENTVPISARDAIVSTQLMAETTIILDKPDVALGVAVEMDNDPPPKTSWATEFQETIFFCRDAANPHYLWLSKRFRPESVPTSNFLEIGNPSDPLQCAVPIVGMLGVFTKKTKYRVVGNDVSGFVPMEALTKKGTLAPLAVIPTEFGIIFPAHDGIYLSNLITQDQLLSGEIFSLFNDETVNDMAPINWAFAETMAAAVFKNRYYFAYPSGASKNPDVIAVYSRETKKWYFYDHPMRSLFVEEDVDDLVGGSTDGFVYILEDGNTDSGSNISLDIETKDFTGGNAHQRKLFMYVRVDIDTKGANVNLELYVDGTLKRTISLNSARNKPLLRFPEGCMGYQWRARIRYTGSARIKGYGLECLWLPLGEA